MCIWLSKEIINNKYFDIDINEDYKVSFVDNSEEGVGGASMGQGRVIAVGLMAVSQRQALLSTYFN